MVPVIALSVESVILARLQMRFGFGLTVMRIIAQIQKDAMEIKKLSAILFSFIKLENCKKIIVNFFAATFCSNK